MGVFELGGGFGGDQLGVALDLDELFVVREVRRDFGPLLRDLVFELGVACVQLEKFERLRFFCLFAKEALNVQDFLILADQFLPVRLEQIRLPVHMFVHFLQSFLENFGDRRLNRLCVFFDLVHFGLYVG